jgi:hypothetical protein
MRLLGDFLVRERTRGETCDPGLLRGEDFGGGAGWAIQFAQTGRPQLIVGAREPRCGVEVREGPPGDAQFGWRVSDSALPMELLAVEQPDAGSVEGPRVDVVRAAIAADL